jgi:hypothetical protein
MRPKVLHTWSKGSYSRFVCSSVEPTDTSVMNFKLPKFEICRNNVYKFGSSLFWVFTLGMLVGFYRRFGTTFRASFQGYWTAWPLNMGLIGCSETSVNNYHHTLCNNSEERRPELHGGGSVQSSAVIHYKVPTMTHKFNLCDRKSLEGHLHSDIFRWHIYHHCQGERELTLKAGTPLVSSTWWTVWRRLSQCICSAGRAILISIPVEWLWRCVHNQDYISPVASQLWAWTNSFPDDGSIYATETCRSEGGPLRTLGHVD